MANEAPVAPPPVAEVPKVETPAPAAVQPPIVPAPEPVAPAADPKTLLGDVKAPPEVVKPQAVEYKDFTLPEGLTPDAKLMDAFKATAKDLGLSQESAQKFVTLQSEHVKAGVEAMVKDAELQKAKMLEDFKQQTIKELGPDYQKELAFAAKALDRFGPPELRALLDSTGFGNHPMMAKFCIAVGKMMSEDGMPGPTGQAPGNDQESQYRTMFPSMYNEDGTKKT